MLQWKNRAGLSAAFGLLSPLAMAQDAQARAQAAASWFQGSTGLIILVVIIVIAVLAGLIFLISNRRAARQGQVNAIYNEPDAEPSKFEQLLAEIQGLSLRTQSGESKGYYRKIEQLARVYIERLGITGARQMSSEEVQHLLTSGRIPQKQAGALNTIFERCRQGAEHESEKLGFTAADLLKDLRALVTQTEEAPAQTVAGL